MLKKTLMLFAASTFLSASAQDIPKVEFEEFDLDNGLHVILHEDHSTPIVAVTVLYHVGSKNENPNRTGFAHFFEHLLFEGSTNIERGKYSEMVEMAGGQLNANTTQDRTFYYEVLPSNQLELGLWLESERMLHAKVEQIGIETQREVVKEEKRQRNDNQPFGSLMDETFKHAYNVHPYKWTPIGSMDHIDAAQEEDYVNFYKTYYVPHNATLSISGDINSKEAKELINKYFASIPNGEKLNIFRDFESYDSDRFFKKYEKSIGTTKEKFVASIKDKSTEEVLKMYFKKASTKPNKIERPSIKEPAITSEIRDTVYDKMAPMAGVVMAYRMPAQDSPDFYALQMLNNLISGTSSARFNKVLVEKKQLATFAVSFPMPLEDPGIALMLGVVQQGVAADELEKAMNEEIEAMKVTEVTDREFEMLQNQIENQFVSGNQSVAGIAESLANYHTYFGDAKLINEEIKRYQKVTKADIKRVANEYFNKDNRVVLYYLPASEKK